MVYSLANIRGAQGAVNAVGFEGSSYALEDLLPGLDGNPYTGLLEIFRTWDKVRAMIALTLAGPIAAKPLPDPAADDFLAPIRHPANITCTGTNYRDHLVKDLNVTDFDKGANDIVYFSKRPGCLVGAGKTIRYPSQSQQFDWEIELVAVIAQRGRRIPVEDALSHVGAYAIGLDLTARDLQFNKRQRRQFDLFGGKSFDDSGPIGPVVVPAEFVDPEDLHLKLWVNDELKQDSHTREMIWSIAEQISELSQHITLEPGDLLFTGTPAGIAYPKGPFLQVGDRINAEITGLGRLTVEIIEDPDAPRMTLAGR